MHKYQPRVHVLRTTDLETPADVQAVNALHELKNSAASNPNLFTFNFTETKFTTVTAYQNQQVRLA
jgi:T-box